MAELGAYQHGYILHDLPGRMPSTEWARKGVAACHVNQVDRIVGKTNFGADMIESTTLRSVDPTVAFKKVVDSRGKVVRSEPVAALFEQGKGFGKGGCVSPQPTRPAFHQRGSSFFCSRPSSSNAASSPHS